MTIKQTSTLTVGVPVSIYVEYDSDDIRNMIVDEVEDLLYTINRVTEKVVYVTIRVDQEIAQTVREQATNNNMTIVDFTAGILTKE